MNGLLVCFASGRKKNIGDYIQSVAQEQFWDHIDCLCEREALNGIHSNEKINLIMNGWFMWKPHNFPPADCINPLFISFHLNPLFEKDFFSLETINYLKRFSPIGARDIGTKRLLEKYGIESYFSSCLTLTLGNKYKSDTKSNEVIFVDPYYIQSGTRDRILDLKLYFKSIYYLLKYRKKIKPLLGKFQPEKKTVWYYISKKLGLSIAASHFYATFKDAFEDDILLNSNVITHNVEVNKYPTNTDMLNYARLLVNRYSQAKLVVTSRIHCALPCLGLETPVIYVQSNNLESMQYRSPGRMDGIINLFNVLSFDNKLIVSPKFGKISMNTMIKNSDDYMVYKDRLIKAVNDYISGI